MSAPCRDCRADTTPCTGRRGCRHAGKWEWYMVRPDVWARAGGGRAYLCIGCLERRLGRPLTKKDFPDLPINEPSPWDTERLAEAKKESP